MAFTHNASVTLTIGDATAASGNIALNLTGFTSYTKGNSTTSAITFASTSATQQTITWGGKAPGNITFSGSGSSYLFNDGFTGSGSFTQSAGTVNTNGQTLATRRVTLSSGTTLTLGSTQWTLGSTTSYRWDCVSGATVNASSSTLIMDSSSSGFGYSHFASGGQTYNVVTYDAVGGTEALIVSGNPTIATLNVGEGRELWFDGGSTTTITSAFNVNGTSGNPTALKTNSAGNAATVSKSSGTVTCNYLTIQDSTVTGGANFVPVNSTNVSNNTGWRWPSGDLTLAPLADGSINSWTTDSGGTTSLYAAIDEGTASDSDYVRSPVSPTSSQYYETWLESHSDPAASSGHTVRYRYEKNVAGGNVDLTVSLRQGASTEIASWAHTNIPNSWTQQDQTLSGGQADSITDYNDLRLRFTPSTTTSDQVPTFVADRASANSNSAVTTVDLVLTGLTVGNYLIIRSAADNSGGGGAARTLTMSNQSGTAMGTHTEYQKNNDPGSASAGVTCNVSVIKIAATSGTIRLTYSGSVVQACVAEEWSGIDGTTPVVGTPVTANGTASTNLVADTALTDASIAARNVAYGAVAVEGPSTDLYTQDADTTNGSWSDLTKLGTTNVTADTNMTVYGGYKAVTAAGAQTYNPTLTVTARDSAGIILELAAAPATIRTQVSWANLELPSSVWNRRRPPVAVFNDPAMI